MQPMSAIRAALALAHAHVAVSTMLPSVSLSEQQPINAPWTVVVEDRVYHTPPSLLGLSQNISHYFYTHGSASALPPSLSERIVGGNDHWHILHIPDEDPSFLMTAAARVAAHGDRRNSASALVQLSRGQVFPGKQDYPAYVVSLEYANPVAFNSVLLHAERQAVSHVTPESVMNYVTTITQLGSRSDTQDETRHRAENWVEDMFHQINGRANTCRQTFGSGRRQNIITHIPGHAEEEGIVILGAHYDSRPFTGAAPGANDNGSGVATMLATLSALVKSGLQPRKTIFFVGLAGEETGTHGSQHLAGHLKASSGRLHERIGCDGHIKARPEQSFLRSGWPLQGGGDMAKAVVLVLDEVGWASPRYPAHTVNVESYDPTDSLPTDWVMDPVVSAFAAHAPHVKVIHNSAPYSSDHVSFLHHAFPTAMVINGDDDAYPAYHSVRDTPDKVSAEYITSVAQSTLAGIVRMAHAMRS